MAMIVQCRIHLQFFIHVRVLLLRRAPPCNRCQVERHSGLLRDLHGRRRLLRFAGRRRVLAAPSAVGHDVQRGCHTNHSQAMSYEHSSCDHACTCVCVHANHRRKDQATVTKTSRSEEGNSGLLARAETCGCHEGEGVLRSRGVPAAGIW